MTPLPPKTQRVLEWIQDFVVQNQITPTYREIAEGLGYRSAAPIQRHIQLLEEGGFITKRPRKSRSLRLLDPATRLMAEGIPIYGAIAASSFLEVFPDSEVEYIEIKALMSQSRSNRRFALRVRGDSMVGALIDQGDVVILEKPTDPRSVKNGTIVAARVEGKTTLKRWYQEGEQVFLHPENPNYSIMEVPAQDVFIEGVYVGIIRGLV